MYSIVHQLYFNKKYNNNNSTVNNNLLFIYLFIYFWLCWVFASVQELSLVAASGGHSIVMRGPLHYHGLSCCGAQAPDAQAQ